MPTLRQYGEDDLAPLQELAVRAWAPVFASLRQALGEELFGRMHPDWRADQRRAVAEACTATEHRVRVAEAESAVVGFAVTRATAEEGLGEVSMIAVDPDWQRAGVARALMAWAEQDLRRAGMSTALVETGGDPGHAPARGLYERLGFTPLPAVRYFKDL